MKNNWKEKKFNDCIEKIQYTAKILKKDFLEQGKYPIISQEEEYINGYWNNKKDLFKITKPVVIFGDHTKKIKYIDFDFVLGADGVKILQPIDEIDTKFFYYALLNMKIRDLGYARHYKLLQEKFISFPASLQQQKQIVEKLDKAFANIDKLTEITKQNLENSKELFNSYLNKLFTENTNNWEEKKLSEIGIIQTGTTPNTREKDNFGNFIPFIKPSDFNKDGTLNYNNQGLSKKGIKQSRFISKNSILMVCIGTIGKVGYNSRDVTCNQQINTLTPKKDSYKFIYYSMIRKKFQNLILRGCPQTTLPIINKSNWSKLKIKLPPLQEQKQIVKILDNLQEKTKKLEEIYNKKIELAKELKQSILHKELSNN